MSGIQWNRPDGSQSFQSFASIPQMSPQDQIAQLQRGVADRKAADGTNRQAAVAQDSLGRATKPVAPPPAAGTLATTDFSKQSLG